MKRLIPLAVLVMLVAAAPARAFYFGASFVNTDAEFRQAVSSFDTDDSSYKFFAGFQAFRFIDIEASYRDLGRHVSSVGPDRLSVELQSYDVAARGVLPLGRRLSVFARGGYAHISQEGELSLSGVVGSIDDDAWELTYGAGLEYRIAKRLSLRAEWEEYDTSNSLSSFSAGATFRF